MAALSWGPPFALGLAIVAAIIVSIDSATATDRAKYESSDSATTIGMDEIDTTAGSLRATGYESTIGSDAQQPATSTFQHVASVHKQRPALHLAFSARIETTAHQLLDDVTLAHVNEDGYPPAVRTRTVYYDYPSRRARIDDHATEHTPPKSSVRRYDVQIEWEVTELEGEKECHKSRLIDAMPFPRFPPNFIYVGPAHVRGKTCEHWREDLGDETVEYFQEADTGYPVRLTTESVEFVNLTRMTRPLMSYDVFDFVAETPPEAAFRIKASCEAPIFESTEMLTIQQCERVVQDMGFPYIHFLHSYFYT